MPIRQILSRRNVVIGVVLAILVSGGIALLVSHSATASRAYKASGVIQSAIIQSGNATVGSLMFLPDTEKTAIKVVFTPQTHISVTAGYYSSTGLLAGAAVTIEGDKQDDGSVLARSIVNKLVSTATPDDRGGQRGTPTPHP